MRQVLVRYVAKQFPTRIQVVRHVSQAVSKSKHDKGKIMCRDMLLCGAYGTVPDGILAKLREKDRIAIRAANKCGKSFPKVPLKPIKHEKRVDRVISDAARAPLDVYEKLLPKRRRLSAKAPPPPSFVLRAHLKRSADAISEHVSQCFTVSSYEPNKFARLDDLIEIEMMAE